MIFGIEKTPRHWVALGVLGVASFLGGCEPGQGTPGIVEVSSSASKDSEAKQGTPLAGGAQEGKEEPPVPNFAGKPEKYLVSAKGLPAPYSTPSAENGSKVIPRPEGVGFHVPPGFEVKLWAKDLENPRIVNVAPNGDVFVTESIPNRIRILRDTDGDGKADFRAVFAENLNQPFGTAFYPPGPNPKYLYVANTDSVVRIPYENGDEKARSAPERVIGDLPGGGYNQHWTRNILFAPNGKKLYVSVGSQTNVGEEEEKRAAILEYNPDGSGYRVFASGIRNPVGLDWNPLTKGLWTACNERDGLGDDVVPDYATEVKEGGFYSWPWYYTGTYHDPRMPEKPEMKARVTLPDVLFTSHVAALGLSFYTAKQFPKAYQNCAYVAMHGSWNRLKRSGYAVVRIPLDKKGKPVGGYEDFVSGWALSDGRVWGRPVDVAVTKDGSMLVTDDGSGKVWIVRYVGEK